MKILIVAIFFVLTILALLASVVSGDKIFVFIAICLFLATWLLKSSLKIDLFKRY